MGENDERGLRADSFRKLTHPQKTVFSLRKELTHNSLGAFALNASGLLLQLSAGIILARVLGTKGYGFYSFPVAVVTLLAIPATLGLPQYLTKTVSQYIAQNRHAALRGLLVRANQVGLVMGLSLAVLATVVYRLVGQAASRSDALPYYVSMTLLPFLALNGMRSAALQGLRKIVSGLIPESLIQPGVYLLIVGPFLLNVTGRLSPTVAMLLRSLTTIVAFVVGTILLLRNVPRESLEARAIFETRLWLRNATPFLLLGTAQIVNNQAGIVLLGIFRPMTDVGVYRTVVQGASLVVFLLMAVNIALAPQVSRLWTLGEREQLQRAITASARIVAFATFCVGTILIVFGRYFLGTVFGSAYQSGTTALRILCAGQIINGLAGSVGTVLNMTGYQRRSAYALVISAMANVLMNFALIPTYGMSGAAIASSAGTVLWNVLLVRSVRKTSNLKTTVFKVI